MKIDTIIFDVDGTLWDSTDLVATAWKRAATECGITEVDFVTGERLKQEFGKPMDVIMDNLFPDHSPAISEKLLTLCCQYEHEILEYAAIVPTYPGLHSTFETLSKQYPLCIVSNCQSGYIEQFLEKTGLGQYVTDIECFGNTLKSKGENLKSLMQRNHFQHAIYVGDTQGDYEATLYAQIPFVFASYGFGQPEGYWKKIEELSDLEKMLQE